MTYQFMTSKNKDRASHDKLTQGQKRSLKVTINKIGTEMVKQCWHSNRTGQAK
jgi:hypothetical protein